MSKDRLPFFPKGISVSQHLSLSDIFEEATKETGLEFVQIIYQPENCGLVIDIFLKGKTSDEEEMKDYYAKKLRDYIRENTYLFKHHDAISMVLSISIPSEKIMLINLA